MVINQKIIPPPPPRPPASNLSNVCSGRQLRQRPEKNYAENIKRNATSTNGNQTNNINNLNSTNSKAGCSFSLSSHTKLSCGGASSGSNNNNSNGNKNISMTELQSSVNIYFGATNRIANGEKFLVHGKRICPKGRVQYLMKWE